ncbi:hypothetical protein [Paenirhodobacter sp. CAU 1674]|uniref:hypothetical protein n=1 Tax=Paenirhodobacter sp. CAU 1674 TaxID=3032596 RepID=UPI0023D9D245|nr:hypothetical protein [Paenirhodobacter sp. CAU 1674]MDF2142931.1 hypothetical protein [Paenirhodobacter sp. CAU 1674]
MAETVTVDNGSEKGHGLVFREGGVCWVIMPRHVAGEQGKVTLYSAAPVVYSGARLETPFWPGMDLAIGVVRGAIEKRCTTPLSALNSASQPETGARVQLLRLRPSGEPERLDMIVTNSTYLTLDARLVDGSADLFKGTSGSFLFDAEKPVGMVVEALSATEARFIRIEEIYQNVARRVARSSGYAQARAPAPTEPPAPDALAFELIEAGLPPIAPQFGEDNLTGPGSYVFRLTQPNRIAFRAVDGQVVTLSGLRITADPEAEAGLPRDIQIDVSSAPDGARTRSVYSGQMPPDGLLDVAISGTRVLWVFVTVRSGWDRAEIGLDAVSFR